MTKPTEAQLKKQDELRAWASHPNMRKMLDVISWAEGADYDTLVGGGKFNDFSRHPKKSVHIKRLGINSTAAGRYQFMNRTWNGEPGKNNGLIHQYGFTDFSPETQDMAAVALIKRRGALEDVLAGDWQKVIDNPEMNKEWASLPMNVYKQGGKTRPQMLARLGAAAAPSPLGEAMPVTAQRAAPASEPSPAETLRTLLTESAEPEEQAESFEMPDMESLFGSAQGPGFTFQGQDGQQYQALPETPQEAERMARWAQMDGDLRSQLMELGRQVGQLQAPADPFRQYPDDYDDQLLSLIDQV